MISNDEQRLKLFISKVKLFMFLQVTEDQTKPTEGSAST